MCCTVFVWQRRTCKKKDTSLAVKQIIWNLDPRLYICDEMSCFHVVLSRLVPPKPQTCVFPHGLRNTSDTPVLEWLRKTFLPPSMCGNGCERWNKCSLKQSVYIHFYDFNSNGNFGSVIITGEILIYEKLSWWLKLFIKKKDAIRRNMLSHRYHWLSI